MMKELLKITNLNIGYSNSKKGIHKVVKDFNLTLDEGEIISILGVSGCGKSTILHAICNLIPKISGDIKFKGKTKPRISTVFQESTLFPWLTVEQNIVYGNWIREKDDKESIANSLLKDLRLENTNHLYPNQLSGGMKQRVDIARALANKPDLLVLDEPFGQLDQQNRFLSEQLLLGIVKNNNIPVILVTHDVEEAIFLSDKIIILGNNPSTIINSFTIDFEKNIDIDSMYSRKFIDMKREIEKILYNEFIKNK